MEPAREHRTDLPALTGLRFFAAMWVVVYHLSGPLLASWPAPALAVIGHGGLGVTFFFMLSGFILSHVYQQRFAGGPGTRQQRVAFWWARFARIYPLYLLALVVYYPLLVRLSAGALATARSLAEQATTLALVQAWFPMLPLQWNHPGWSLSVEAFFYAAFPWMVVGVVRLSRRLHGWRLAFILWAVQAIVLTLLAAMPGLGNGRTIENLRTLYPVWWMPTFLTGIALHLGWAQATAEGVRLRGWVVGAAGAALLALLAIPPAAGGVPYLCATLAAIALFGIVIVWFARPEATRGWLGGPALFALGEASYGIYLLHIPVNGLLSWALGRSFGQPIARTWLEFVLFVAGLCALCLVLHKVYELPARRWLLAHRPRRKPAAPPAEGSRAPP